MATPEESDPVPDAVIQQFILQQAQAAAAGQTHLARQRRQEASLQHNDLITPDVAEGDMPPPAYGDTYGEIRNQNDGLGTSACVTDDGRVNIRINHFNRPLSQILTPVLRRQIQRVQDDPPPPPPYVPPSLGGEEGVPPLPPLNVVIQVVGSRGDVQPFVALGKVLKGTYGHRVRLATHPTFQGFVQENGLEFFNIGGDPSRLMAFMVKNRGLTPGFRSLLSGDVGKRRRDVAEYIQGCWRSCYQTGDGMGLVASDDGISSSDHSGRPFAADCIIANPPSFAHIHCAEKLGIPLHIMFTMPYSPTQAFPHPLANIQSSNSDPQLTNYISYAMIELLSWQALGDILNRFRARCLGLDPVSLIWASDMLQRLQIPHTYCWSPTLIPKPKDWGPHVSISGFCLLDQAAHYAPAPDLQAFLDAGPPPVYIGFGSIVLDDPDAMTELIFEAVEKTGQRVLLSNGWGGMAADQRGAPDAVFMLGNVPHDWLFQHVSCVVQHGGAGTTAAAIIAGRPTIVVPFFGDQHFWGAMVSQAGVGPDPIPHQQLTADKLADAINFCLESESVGRARELAGKVAAERGCDTAAQSFHQFLELDRLRCSLAPNRAAAWRVKRTQVRLSAFAACTLANANLLDFHDLKLFRPREFHTDEGPWDPISGGTMAFAGAVGSMLMGLVDFPSETLKAMHILSGSSRKRSQASVPKAARKSDISRVGGSSTSPTSPEPSQTSLNRHESLTRVRSPVDLSSGSSHPLHIESSSMSDALQRQWRLKQDDPGQSRARSRNESLALLDRDLVRQTGPHTSKGLGRIAKAIVQAPMQISLGFTQGLHNVPKLLGDDTVRPQQQVSDFKSGAKAAGREFGLGWYDGIVGLFTQPWKGAQKDGVGGFLKGIGRGIGGFVAKPCAGVFGIPGYMMKGVHKEVQKLFGSNAQNYIVASRTAQGYDEWLHSPDAEKEEVINRWKLVQKDLERRVKAEKSVREVLETQRKESTENKDAHQSRGCSSSSAHSPNSADALTQNARSATLGIRGSQYTSRLVYNAPGESLEEAAKPKNTRLSVQEKPSGDAEEDDGVERAIQESASQLQHQRQEGEDYRDYREDLRQAMAASKAEASRQGRRTMMNN